MERAEIVPSRKASCRTTESIDRTAIVLAGQKQQADTLGKRKNASNGTRELGASRFAGSVSDFLAESSLLETDLSVFHL